jgi:predicted nucleic acid-binding protein
VRRVFADSLYWIALSSPKDQWHAAAMSASRAVGGAEIVTSQEVLSEFLAALRHTPRLRSIAARRVRQIYATCVVLPQSDVSFRAGLALYEARPDKKFSHTDCTSMEAMRRENITEVLTHDVHFTQEGFTKLL